MIFTTMLDYTEYYREEGRREGERGGGCARENGGREQ